MDDAERVRQLEHEIEGLQEALARRDIIGQAKGILMVTSAVTADEAFRMLVAASQRENVKLHDVALRIAAAAVEREPADAIAEPVPTWFSEGKDNRRRRTEDEARPDIDTEESG